MTDMSLFYRTSDGTSSSISEVAIVLYQGTRPAITGTSAHSTIADVHVVRGQSSSMNSRRGNFTIPNDETYFVAFYSGFYDQGGNGVELGKAIMIVDAVIVSTP
jgi:hypothetical protein